MRYMKVWNLIQKGRHLSTRRRDPIKYMTKHETPEEASLAWLLGTKSIIGTSSKVVMGEFYQWLTKVMYFAPFNLSGFQVCPFATPACKKDCLGHSSGNLVFQGQTEVLRTWSYYLHSELFHTKLDMAIKMLGMEAVVKGMQAAVRLNGSSDLDWSDVIERHAESGVQFYDYTKDFERAVASIGTNYHLTYSISEKPESWEKGIYLVQRGGTAAVVTHRNKKKAAAFGQLLSDRFGVGVADGDRHDLRFLDKGKLVTLTAKGSMKEESKFVWTREQFDKLAG